MISNMFEATAFCGKSQINAGLIEPSSIKVIEITSHQGGEIPVPHVAISVLANSIGNNIQIESCSRRNECHNAKCTFPVPLKKVEVDRSTALVVELN